MIKPSFKSALRATILLAASLSTAIASATTVQFQTSMGNFEVNLYDNRTPETVENFLAYVNAGSYTDSIIHRSVDNFVVQGGGFSWEGDNTPAAITTNAAITNEPVYSNVAGTIAMAKTGGNVNSATNQWFFNLQDNGANLDVQNGGFTAFGQTDAEGMAILNAMNDLPTYNMGGAFSSIPLMDYTTDDASNNVPVSAEHVVTIQAIVILDATVDTLGSEQPKENDRIDEDNAGGDNYGDSSGGGGSLSLLGLLALAGLLALRKKRFIG